jgi:uncharacterized membrane protein
LEGFYEKQGFYDGILSILLVFGLQAAAVGPEDCPPVHQA